MPLENEPSAFTWEPPEVGDSKETEYAIVQPVGNRPKQKRGIVAPTAEQLLEMQRAAEKEGYNTGHAKGLEQGLDKGYKDGLAKGEAEINDKLARLTSMIDLVAQPAVVIDEEMEEQLSSMCMLIAKQIIRREIKTQPGEVIAVVREALSILPITTQNVKVLVNPEDAELLREVGKSPDDDTVWKIVEDPMLTRGGCQIVTDISRIDATLEKRIANLAHQLFGDERNDLHEIVGPDPVAPSVQQETLPEKEVEERPTDERKDDKPT